MKTKRAFSLGFAAILALVAVIGFTACSDDSNGSSGSGTSASSSFVGTWTYTDRDGDTETLTINSDGSWDSSRVDMTGAPSYNSYSEYDSTSGYLYLYISVSGYGVFDFGYCYIEGSTLVWDWDDGYNPMTMTKQQ